MGRKGSKARNEAQRRRKPDWERGTYFTSEITTGEIFCSKCGFKARYKFIRCPECGEAQLSPA